MNISEVKTLVFSIIGTPNSEIVSTNVNKALESMDGIIKGKVICKKILNSDESHLAESSTSELICFRALPMNRIVRGRYEKTNINAHPQIEFRNCDKYSPIPNQLLINPYLPKISFHATARIYGGRKMGIIIIVLMNFLNGILVLVKISDMGIPKIKVPKTVMHPRVILLSRSSAASTFVNN
jgi:hypothetical protein